MWTRSALVLLLALGAGCHRRAGARPRGHIAPLAADRLAVHADGARGDLALRDAAGATLTVSTGETLPGHRPLRGAVVDARPDGDDAPDPLLWWRPAVIDPRGAARPLLASSVRAVRCGRGHGVEVRGDVGDARIVHRVCALGDGRFRAVTEVAGLPAGHALGDEINPGSATVLVQGRGQGWEGEVPTRTVILAERGVALVFASTSDALARRGLVHIAAETFPAPVRWSTTGARWTRTLQVLRGDALDALAHVHPTSPAVQLASPGAGSTVEWLGDDDEVLAEAALDGPRALRFPPGAPARLRVRDPWGVATPVLAGTGEVALPAIASQPLRIVVEGEVPAHALLHRLDGPDPVLRLPSGAPGATAGRSVYLPHGDATVRVAPGRYRVTVSRGTGWTLSAQEVTVADAPVEHRVTLRAVVDATRWAAADLHLHAAPSPDSRVSLDERVMSLACNGIDLGVATDHNRITDYRPALARTGLAPWLAVVAGDEVTSAGASLWGHFNAFPLAVPEGAGERGALPYFDREPAQLFAGARAAGARVIQVNHPRMPPRIGYFDLAGLDADTGVARTEIAPDFDAVEAHNGIWLEQPARVREGLRDVIALARRGIRATATGNSDSHRLLLEEAGYPRTWARVPAEPRETLGARVIEAVRQGDVTVSAGPLVEVTVDGDHPGAVLGPRASVRVSVTVIAPAWVPVERVEVWRDDVAVHTVDVPPNPVDGVRWQGVFDVPVTADAAVLVWVEAQTPLPDVLPYRDARAIGFSSPVWIDADGDGRVRLPPRARPASAPGSTAAAP
ncbi:MAG: CehA/McbA family metallohydrolase [Polyangiales bacterium]